MQRRILSIVQSHYSTIRSIAPVDSVDSQRYFKIQRCILRTSNCHSFRERLLHLLLLLTLHDIILDMADIPKLLQLRKSCNSNRTSLDPQTPDDTVYLHKTPAISTSCPKRIPSKATHSQVASPKLTILRLRRTQRLHCRPRRLPPSNDAPHLDSDGVDLQRRGDAGIDTFVESLHGLIGAADVTVTLMGSAR